MSIALSVPALPAPWVHDMNSGSAESSYWISHKTVDGEIIWRTLSRILDGSRLEAFNTRAASGRHVFTRQKCQFQLTTILGHENGETEGTPRVKTTPKGASIHDWSPWQQVSHLPTDSFVLASPANERQLKSLPGQAQWESNLSRLALEGSRAERLSSRLKLEVTLKHSSVRCKNTAVFWKEIWHTVANAQFESANKKTRTIRTTPQNAKRFA